MVTSLLPGSRRGSRRRQRQEPKPKQRLDIQGLRMIAVMLVVLDHLFAWPRGGFIGVDVFFVISGFLITGQLMKSLHRTGRVSFSDFYRKRVRRIFPAATLVLVATCLAAYPIFSASRFQSTLVDGGWAFVFIANWRYGLDGTDYFNADGPASPFQHYWSLSVEEQFYVVWPVVIMLIGILVARRSLASKMKTLLAASVMGAIVAVSFGWALIQSANSPTWAYFSTFTRVWELGVGALLAMCLGAFDRIPDSIRPLLAWVGILAIAVGAFTIAESSGFPAPGAALPVLGSALVIGAGAKGEQRFLQPLTNRASVYIGDISYSLYLWHWPVIILLGSLMEQNLFYYAAAVPLMFGLSIASYHFVENPIRRSNWLAPQATRAPGSRKGFTLPSVRWSQTAQHAGIVALTLLTVGIASYALRPIEVTGVPNRTSPLSFVDAKATPVKLGPAGTTLAQAIEAAVVAGSWPDLKPSMDEGMTSLKAHNGEVACGSPGRSSESTCSWGSPSAIKTIMVLGDSIAMGYIGPLRSFAENSAGQWRVSSKAMAACPFVDIEIPTSDAAAFAACPEGKLDAIRAVNEARPDVVIIANVDFAAQPGDWVAGMRRYTDQFSANVGQIIYLAAPPADVKISDCYNRINKPADCISRVTASWYERASSARDLTASIKGQFIDTRLWFCTPDDYCPSFVATTPMKADKWHITPEYGELIAPAVAETLHAAGL